MWAVAPHDLLKAVKRQRIDGATVFASHRLRHAESVEYRLLGGLRSSAKKTGHGGGGQHADIRDLLIYFDVVSRREGDEDVAAAVAPDAADPSKAGCRATGEALALEGDEWCIGREHHDDRPALVVLSSRALLPE